MNPLNELLELAQQREELEAKVVAAVAAARADGASWQAIANKLGGTKQAAQQRYGKNVGTYIKESNAKSKAEHEKYHAEDKQKLAEYAASRAAQQLAEHAEATAIFLDGTVPAPEDGTDEFAGAHAMATAILAKEAAAKTPTKDQLRDEEAQYAWQSAAPRRLDGPKVDVSEDFAPVYSGDYDTAGTPIDWSGLKASPCKYCGQRKHYTGKGAKKKFWIYPGCNPTTQDSLDRN